jgi:modulator of FtsH protease HflC
VYQAMEAERKRIAAQAASRGEAESAAIKSSAETDARKIMAFVGRRADAIKGQGDKEASSWLAQQKQDPQLAVFLQNLRFLREALSTKRTTLVLPMSFPGLQLLDPAVIEKLGKGQVPETLPVGVMRPTGAASGGGGQ